MRHLLVSLLFILTLGGCLPKAPPPPGPLKCQDWRIVTSYRYYGGWYASTDTVCVLAEKPISRDVALAEYPQ